MSPSRLHSNDISIFVNFYVTRFKAGIYVITVHLIIHTSEGRIIQINMQKISVTVCIPGLCQTCVMPNARSYASGVGIKF